MSGLFASGLLAPGLLAPGRLRHAAAAVAAFCVISLSVPSGVSAAAPCEGTLGTSRVMEVPGAGLQLGTKHFPQTLDLADGEVVLTFDDGPHPGTTEAVLKALAKECVRATFFLIGRNATAHPELARRLLAEGHTVAYHSETHPMTLADLPFDKAVADIEKGFVSVDKAVYGGAGAHPRVPFFRFPGFGSSPELLKYLGDRGIDTFDADLWASDWNPMTPDAQLKLLMERLDHQRRGIILLHDTRAQTARMVPAFLAELKAKGYRVVHVVPAGVTTAAKP